MNFTFILLIAALGFFFVNNIPSDGQIAMEGLDNLSKKGLTIYQGNIMTLADAKAAKLEDHKPNAQLYHYGDKIWQFKSQSMKEFNREKQALLNEMNEDRSLLPSAKANIMKMLGFREKTMTYLEKNTK